MQLKKTDRIRTLRFLNLVPAGWLNLAFSQPSGTNLRKHRPNFEQESSYKRGRVKGLGFGVNVLGFRVWGLGFEVQGLKLRVCGLPCAV